MVKFVKRCNLCKPMSPNFTIVKKQSNQHDIKFPSSVVKLILQARLRTCQHLPVLVCY
jgi:hypothetical protein